MRLVKVLIENIKHKKNWGENSNGWSKIAGLPILCACDTNVAVDNLLEGKKNIFCFVLKKKFKGYTKWESKRYGWEEQ